MNAARYCNRLSPAFKMRPEDTQYFTQFAVAFARGRLQDSGSISDEERQLLAVPLENLSAEQRQTTIELGKQHELKMHKFKRTMGLARVSSVLGILRGLHPASLLDVGSGRDVEPPTYADLLSRNNSRDAAVPEHVIERLADKLEVPDLSEAHTVEWVTH